jgi:WD40 repeat protein
MPESAPAFDSYGVDAVEELVAWTCDNRPGSPAFCAVLGELGIGKTTTLKMLTRRLLELRAHGREAPLPIFADLKRVELTPARPDDEEDSALKRILASVIRNSWERPSTPSISPDEIIELVRSGDALIMWDGLDEKLVHMGAEEGRIFISQLWKIIGLPSALPEGRPNGKLIMSCRSHYFPNVTAQHGAFTGHGRTGVRDEDYKVLILLPFNDDQVRQYLKQVLVDDERVRDVLDLFASVHNLDELSRRPLLLSLIRDQLGDLEQRRSRGERVLGVSLYDGIVDEWLDRDTGKHTLLDTHKPRIMEALAAEMWRDGAREWTWTKLADWFDQFLHDNPVIAGRYVGKSAEVMNEDLRTATFVLRPDDSRESFRFAHTSIQEYFLARYLVAGLENDDAAVRWDLGMPSLETLDFVGQLLTLRGTPRMLRTLAGLLEVGAEGEAARVAFRYWLLAVERGYPEPVPTRVVLRGADLSGWTIRGASAQRPLVLTGADLAGCDLAQAKLEHVDLGGASLVGGSIRCAELVNCRLVGADLSDTDASGSIWHTVDARDLVADTCNWQSAELSRCDLTAARMGLSFAQRATTALIAGIDIGRPERSAVGLIVPGVFGGVVNDVAWSPDGSMLATGSGDWTARVWDAESGRELRALEGHGFSVNAVAWSADGRLATGSADGTARVWDAESGRLLRALEGHTNWVMSVAWSADGRLATGSDDGTARVWDAESGRLLRALEGHTDYVRSVAWSADGRLATGSADGTARVWDAESGRLLRALEGHTDYVRSVAWSADGRLATGSADGTARVWDAESGRELRALAGHWGSVNAVAWSADGRLATGSDDGTARVWDAMELRCMNLLRVLPDAQSMSSEGHDSSERHDARLMWASSGAWRWIGWSGWDPELKRLRRWPAEVFGPLPGADDDVDR